MPRLGERKPLAERFWSKVQKSDGCWLWQGKPGTNGYGRTHVYRGETLIRNVQAHRVAWEIYHGAPPPEDKLVLHRCDVPLCVREDHLYLGDHAQNTQDMVDRNRQSMGDRHPDSKLRAENIPTIRRLIAEGHGDTEIGRRFGVSDSAINFIRKGKNWKHVPA